MNTSVDSLANKLYYGDNLGILRSFPDACVDLVYLDPPWNPKADYNVIFKDELGRKSNAQRDAFAGTWHWSPTAEDHFAFLHRPPDTRAPFQRRSAPLWPLSDPLSGPTRWLPT